MRAEQGGSECCLLTSSVTGACNDTQVEEAAATSMARSEKGEGEKKNTFRASSIRLGNFDGLSARITSVMCRKVWPGCACLGLQAVVIRSVFCSQAGPDIVAVLASFHLQLADNKIFNKFD